MVLPRIILVLSLIGNIYLIYQNKLSLVLTQDLKKQNDKLISEHSSGCTRFYSVSESKYICLNDKETKAKILSECSQKFISSLDQNVLGALKTLTEVEKLQNLIVKTCMQSNGYDY